MPSLNRIFPVALAVGSGLVTTGLLYTYLVAQPSHATVTLEPMVVAAMPLSDSKPLSEDDVKVVQVLQRPTGAFTNIGEIKGRLPLVAIGKGEPILTSHLAPAGAQPGLWNHITPGKRALTVAVNEVVGVGGFLKPGLNVDVIAVSRNAENSDTRLAAQDVPILALAQDDKDKRDSNSAKVVTSATLLVTPEQAEAVSAATEQGQIRLVLRAPGDHKIIKQAPPKAKPAAPAEHHPAPQRASAPAARPAPAQPAAPTRPGIEVIRGNDTEVVHP